MKKSEMRKRIREMPPLQQPNLRRCQLDAITGLERSLAAGHSRTLIQMATGAGKTVTAVTAVHRLLTHGAAERVLFLVDTKSLADQAYEAFYNYETCPDYAFPTQGIAYAPALVEGTGTKNAVHHQAQGQSDSSRISTSSAGLPYGDDGSFSQPSALAPTGQGADPMHRQQRALFEPNGEFARLDGTERGEVPPEVLSADAEKSHAGTPAQSGEDATFPFRSQFPLLQLKSGRKVPANVADYAVHICTIQRFYSLFCGSENTTKNAREKTEKIGIQRSKHGKEKRGKSKGNRSVESPASLRRLFPRDMYDLIIIDECHRSIYGQYGKALQLFNGYIVGLTATPDERTLEWFHYNVAGTYSRLQAVQDGVNVPGELYVIDTRISRGGGVVNDSPAWARNKYNDSIEQFELGEPYEYSATQLDRDIVNMSQIRTVIHTLRERMFTELFPDRQEVPKTLIFAKNDRHANDIVAAVMEEFCENTQTGKFRQFDVKTAENHRRFRQNDENEKLPFCCKITYQAQNPAYSLEAFRNNYYPRIAVTVDMIATGTDVKAIECLVFMRNVKSRNFFEQMQGRGTRTLTASDLQLVSPSATAEKQRFVIVDAVGVTESEKYEKHIAVAGKTVVDMDDAIHHTQSENPLQIIDTENEDELLFAGYRQYELTADNWLRHLSPEALERKSREGAMQ